MSHLIETSRRILGVFSNRRKEASFDPELILQEIASTEEMKYYLDARKFWTSKEGKQIRKGQYTEGPSLARVNVLLPGIREANIVRDIMPKAITPLISEIKNAWQLKNALSESLHRYDIIPTKSPNHPAFKEWYSRYLPPDDMRIYEGLDFDGTPKSWDKFVVVDLSLTLAFLEFTHAHPETLKKR